MLFSRNQALRTRIAELEKEVQAVRNERIEVAVQASTNTTPERCQAWIDRWEKVQAQWIGHASGSKRNMMLARCEAQLKRWRTALTAAEAVNG